MHQRGVLAAVSFLLLAIGPPATTSDAKGESTPARALIERVPDWMRQYNVPIVAVAVIRNGAIERTDVFGERQPGVRAGRDTVFNVASLTKPVVAMMSLRLAASGGLRLDESLAPYWVDPDVANDPRHRKLTLRVILSHQTGFPNWRGGQKLAFAFDPGTRFQYSGEGFEYLKSAVERKTGRTLPELVEANVFVPAGMRSSSFTWFAEAEGRFATGFNSSREAYPVPRRKEPSAADDLLTTIDDYARFVAWVLNGAGLPEGMRVDMQTPQVRDGKGFNFGLGWQLLIDGETTILTHGGSDEGVKTEVLLVPATRDAVVVFTNSDNGDLLMRLIFEQASEQGAVLQRAKGRAIWQFLEQLPPRELGSMIAGGILQSASGMDKLLQAVEAQCLDASGLDEREKGDAKSAFRRMVRAMSTNDVGSGAAGAIAATAFRRTTDGGWQLKDAIPDGELRALISTARRAADNAGIPD